MNRKSLAHLSLFAAQVIYALNYSIAKYAMPAYVKPFALVLLRVIGALILFWVSSIFIKKEKVAGADLKKFALLAVFGVAMNQLCFLYGLNLTTPVNSAIIMISNPIVVIVFTLWVFKEKVTIYKVSGLGLGILGAVILLLFRGNFTLGSETFAGDFITLINSFSWAIFVVMAKPYMMKYNTITVMKWLFFFGLFLVFPFGFSELREINWASFTTKIWFSVGFIVIATTFLAYLFNTWALKELSSSVVSSYIYYQPFLATFFAILFGTDSLSIIKIIAAVCIIAGVYFVSYQPSKKKLENA